MNNLTLQHFGVPANDKTEYFLTIPAVGNEVFAENVALVEEIGDSLVMPISKFLEFVDTILDPQVIRKAINVRLAVVTGNSEYSTDVPNLCSEVPMSLAVNAWYDYD